MTVLHWKEICREGEAIHLARVSAPQPRNWQLHRHDFHECFLVDVGTGLHLLGGKGNALEKGMLVFIRPEHVHGFHVSSRNRFTLTNIALQTAVVEDFQSRFNRLLYPIKAWETGQEPALFRMNALMQKRFDQLVDDLAWGDRSDLDAFFFLCGLFRLINGRSTQLAGTGIPDWLQNALLHMEQPENLQAGAPRLVELCGRTPEHVSRSFQRYLKQTPSTWVNGLRIRLARQLLETTDLSITQVGYECGYETLSYFHRCFKNAVGATPLAHRNLANRSLGMG